MSNDNKPSGLTPESVQSIKQILDQTLLFDTLGNMMHGFSGGTLLKWVAQVTREAVGHGLLGDRTYGARISTCTEKIKSKMDADLTAMESVRFIIDVMREVGFEPPAELLSQFAKDCEEMKKRD